MTVISARQASKAIKTILIFLIGGVMMFGLFGCKNKSKDPSAASATGVKYKVIYDGDSKSWYQNAKDTYAPGEQVELYYNLIATDTDYSFTLDDAPVNYQYDEDKGFVIRFTMPEYDVTLKCISKNSMVYVPPTEEPDTMLVDSYRAITGTDGGDGYDEYTLYSYDSDSAKLYVYHQQGDASETETVYLVPGEVIGECYAAIERHMLRSWKTVTDPVAYDGATLVCKYKDGDQYVRVTSDKMPEDGEEAFSEIEAVLKSYIKPEYLIQE